MKDFDEMSQLEIEEMRHDDFMAVSPFKKKSCYDCGNLTSALSWWCASKEAIKSRGTSIPGVIKCKFWVPDWEMIDEKYRTEENGHVEKKSFIKSFFNR